MKYEELFRTIMGGRERKTVIDELHFNDEFLKEPLQIKSISGIVAILPK